MHVRAWSMLYGRDAACEGRRTCGRWDDNKLTSSLSYSALLCSAQHYAAGITTQVNIAIA